MQYSTLFTAVLLLASSQVNALSINKRDIGSGELTTFDWNAGPGLAEDCADALLDSTANKFVVTGISEGAYTDHLFADIPYDSSRNHRITNAGFVLKATDGCTVDSVSFGYCNNNDCSDAGNRVPFQSYGEENELVPFVTSAPGACTISGNISSALLLNIDPVTDSLATTGAPINKKFYLSVSFSAGPSSGPTCDINGMVAFDYKPDFQTPIESLEVAENPTHFFQDNSGSVDLAYYYQSFYYFPNAGSLRLDAGQNTGNIVDVQVGEDSDPKWRFNKMNYYLQTSGGCGMNFDVIVSSAGTTISEWSRYGLVSGASTQTAFYPLGDLDTSNAYYVFADLVASSTTVDTRWNDFRIEISREDTTASCDFLIQPNFGFVGAYLTEPISEPLSDAPLLACDAGTEWQDAINDFNGMVNTNMVYVHDDTTDIASTNPVLVTIYPGSGKLLTAISFHYTAHTLADVAVDCARSPSFKAFSGANDLSADISVNGLTSTCFSSTDGTDEVVNFSSPVDVDTDGFMIYIDNTNLVQGSDEACQYYFMVSMTFEDVPTTTEETTTEETTTEETTTDDETTTEDTTTNEETTTEETPTPTPSDDVTDSEETTTDGEETTTTTTSATTMTQGATPSAAASSQAGNVAAGMAAAILAMLA